MDMEWLQRLDAATDYVALHEALFGPKHHLSGDEMWAKCPLHGDCDDPGKWSVNTTNGQWKCFKSGEGGSYLGLIRKLRPQTWRDDWIAACPRTAEVFQANPSPKAPKLKLGSNLHKDVDFFATARDAAALTTDEDLAPLSEAWAIPVAALREMGWFVMRGGKEGGAHPKYTIPVYQADKRISGLRHRFLKPYPTVRVEGKEPREIKSRLATGSKVGIIGMAQLERVATDGKPLPVIKVEGEKDWAVALHTYGATHAVISPSHGSSSVASCLPDLLRNRDVTLLYDEDEAGNKGARTVLSTLLGVAASLKWAHLNTPGQDVFNLLRETEGGKALVDKALAEATLFSKEEAVKDVAALIRASMPEDGQPDIRALANHIYDVLTEAGAIWIAGDDGNAYCNFDGRAYQCCNADHGWVMRLGEWTGLDSFGSMGMRLHRQVRSVAGERGIKTDPKAWYAHRDGVMYLPLGGKHGDLVEMSESGIRQVKNGSNGVVIMPNDRMLEFKWDERHDAAKGLEAWSRFISLFTCSYEDRALLDAWLTAIYLYEFNETHPLMRFVGAPGSGKSFAAKLLTTLVMGKPTLNISTTAAMYRITANQPLFCLDNIEAQHMTEDLHTFLLLAATGATKAKSNLDTSSGVIHEQIRSWIITTGIDPVSFGKRELVERTVIVPFGVIRETDFMPRKETRWVEENRNLLLNHLFRRVWSTFLRVREGALDRALHLLPGSVRPRLRDFYALCIVARNVVGGDDTIINFMMAEHAEDENDATVNDNPLVTLLQQLPFFVLTASGKDLGMPLKKVQGGWQSDWVTSQRMHVVLSACSRAIGLRYPYETPQHMTTRLGLALKQMDDIGYRFERGEHAINGKRTRAWRFFVPAVAGQQVTDLYGATQNG